MGIVTKKGDKGTTSICQGTIGKDHRIIQALGSIDEVNSFLGLAISFLSDRQIKEALQEIQNNLLVIGSLVYGAKINFPKENLTKIEASIEILENNLPPLKNFILPGGSKEAGFLHVARVAARKAERDLVVLSKKKLVLPIVLSYLNRLSDYLFLLARFVNREEGEDKI